MSSLSSLSSLWDSRFDESHISKEAFISTDIAHADTLKISSILAAAGRALPIIYPQQLQFYCHLGSGSCFKVDCEIYTKEGGPSPELVAVKYLRLPRSPDPETSKFYDGVMRELRVLTHPPFRNHECLIEALAYGWATSPEQGVHPYLVLDYSDHGNLAVYLQRITPPVDQCRNLALDVAVGLQALHQSDIIHGDLKPENVLVLDCSGERPQVAKLADFGASIFEVDFDDGPVSYRGTPRYNAPEQEGRLGPQAWKMAQTKEGFYKADIYSLGLVVWEIMNDGDEFYVPEWLMNGETELQFLDRICEVEEDGLLSRAQRFCENRFQDLDQPVIKQAIGNTFEVTLRNDATLRANIDQVINLLANGVSKVRPKPIYPRIRQEPISKHYGEEPLIEGAFKIPLIKTMGPMDREARRQYRLSCASVPAGSRPALNVYQEAEKIVRSLERPLSRSGTAKSPAPIKSAAEVTSLSLAINREPAQTASSFSQRNLDIFQVFSTSAFPPWSIQCSIVEELRSQTRSNPSTAEAADAHFQLSLCYQTGFGVEPDADEVLRNLQKALLGNTIAKSIYHRMEMAYRSQVSTKLYSTTDADDQLELLVSDPLYFSHRLRVHQKTLNQYTKQRSWRCNYVQFTFNNLKSLDMLYQSDDCHQPCISADTPGVLVRRRNLLELFAEIGSVALVERLLNDQNWNDKELSCALLKACEYGHLATASLLASHCPQLQYDGDGPSPLHWLIMFGQDEARQLAALLVLGSSGDIENANGICKDMINAMPRPGSEPSTFSEHCLQLAGSPLHWAVGARNLPLAELLIQLGASIHLRWSHNRAPENGYPDHQRPGSSPFELALAWHLPELCDALWRSTPSSSQAELLESAVTIHPIGKSALPFLRYIIHGANHVDALRDTIRVLQAWGFEARCKNKHWESAFMAALADPEQEIYVLHEIMSMSDRNDEITSDGKNAATLVAATSSRRQHNVQRMKLVVDRVSNINDTDESGMNALHYVAVGDNARLCQVLLQSNILDLNKQNANGDTATHLAASLNATRTLHLLLQYRADIEVLNSDKQTPLALAILHRQKAAIRSLIEVGADINLGSLNDTSKTSALHLAVSEPSSSSSIARHLLEAYPKFRDPSQLNLLDGSGWTPLHKAAYLGDHEGVAALLDHGADSELPRRRRSPVAQRLTALDITSSLLESISTNSCLSSAEHSRIREGGQPAIDAFKLRLEEVRLILQQKSLGVDDKF